MPFRPNPGETLTLDGVVYRFMPHPAAPRTVYSQEGRQGIAFQLQAAGGQLWALKHFKVPFGGPPLVQQAQQLAPFAALPGLQICARRVLIPEEHGPLLDQYPELKYAVLMPWVDGPTWQTVIAQRQPISAEQGLACAYNLAKLLTLMEEQRLAHCDLSGANLLLPGLLAPPLTPLVALVDGEEFFGPHFVQPKPLPTGSLGYHAPSADNEVWHAYADRFAGAILLAEILAWCDPRVRDRASQSSYFAPEELQQPSQRYDQLIATLTQQWGAPVAQLLAQTWASAKLSATPSFSAWLSVLPDPAQHSLEAQTIVGSVGQPTRIEPMQPTAGPTDPTTTFFPRTPPPPPAAPAAPQNPSTPAARPPWLLIAGGLLLLLLLGGGGLALLATRSVGSAQPPTLTATAQGTASGFANLGVATAEPTATRRPRLTATPTPEGGVLPTATPTPTPIPSATPTATPEPTPTPVVAPVSCSDARTSLAPNAISCYNSALAAQFLQAGYTQNIFTLRNRQVLRANQVDSPAGVWTRDVDYATSGYSYVLDELEVMRNSIELLLDGVRADGVVPEGIFSNSSDYIYGQSWDSMPNLIHAVYLYVAKTGDIEFYLEHRSNVLSIANWIVSLDSDGDGMPDRDVFPYGYYNSVENGPLHTYALARFYAAYREIAELEARLSMDANQWHERADQLRAGFNRSVAAGGYWRDDQPWPIAWKRADGRVVPVLETFGVFAALNSGLIAPEDERYSDLIVALHENLPALLDGPVPMRLALGGYERDVQRSDMQLPAWKFDASAPWIVGRAVIAYARAGYSDDARRILAAYEQVASGSNMPRLQADDAARYGAGSEGSGGTWEYAAWFMAVYQGHYGLMMTPATLIVQPQPFLNIENDGIGNIVYQDAVVQLALDPARRVYSLQASQPITVIFRPMGQAQLVRVNGGEALREVTLEIEADVDYVVESIDGSR